MALIERSLAATKLVEAPTTYPVSVTEAKLHCKIDDSAEDSLVANWIAAATQECEHRTGRALMPQTWEIRLNAFPRAFELTRVPVASVTSVKYLDGAGVEQTLDPALWLLDADDDFGVARVVPAWNATWPTTRDQINAVRLRYLAGYADASRVPAALRQWILLAVGDMSAHRERSAERPVLPQQFAAGLLDTFRVLHA